MDVPSADVATFLFKMARDFSLYVGSSRLMTSSTEFGNVLIRRRQTAFRYGRYFLSQIHLFAWEAAATPGLARRFLLSLV